MKLVIANKAYSSWSMRPWILMRHFEIPFEEEVIPLRHDDTRERILRFSPAGKCPVLIDGDVVVGESLAIIEYLADRHPELPIWPCEFKQRARARALAAEMHAGFAGLRAHLPMNMRRAVKALEMTSAAAADVARIEAAFAEALQTEPHGPFLIGTFGGADAMFAPIVNRLHVYDVPVTAQTRAYMDAFMALPAWQDWAREATQEIWHIEAIDDL